MLISNPTKHPVIDILVQYRWTKSHMFTTGESLFYLSAVIELSTRFFLSIPTTVVTSSGTKHIYTPQFYPYKAQKLYSIYGTQSVLIQFICIIFKMFSLSLLDSKVKVLLTEKLWTLAENSGYMVHWVHWYQPWEHLHNLDFDMDQLLPYLFLSYFQQIFCTNQKIT